jgi:hypothetical protein
LLRLIRMAILYKSGFNSHNIPNSSKINITNHKNNQKYQRHNKTINKIVKCNSNNPKIYIKMKINHKVIKINKTKIRQFRIKQCKKSIRNQIKKDHQTINL